jgi:hypothetical protein
MLSSLQLDKVGPLADLTLDFRPRLNVLTGDNGLGKTLLLDIVWYVLAGSWSGQPVLPYGKGQASISNRLLTPRHKLISPLSVFVSTELGWSNSYSEVNPPTYFHQFSEPPQINQTDSGAYLPIVVYFRVDGSVAIEDPVINGARRRVFAQDELWHGKDEEATVLLSGLIRHWLYWEQSEPKVFEALMRTMSILSENLDEELKPGRPRKISISDDRIHPTIKLPYGDIPITHLSAGMKRVLSIAYMLVWSWYNHVETVQEFGMERSGHLVVLLDEPEGHLHPKWQRVIAPAVMRALDALNQTAEPPMSIQFFISTHSPMVLASLEGVFDPNIDSLQKFDLVDRQVRVESLDWTRRGDASSWLTSEVFDLKQPRSVEAEKAIEEAMASIDSADMPTEQLR